MVAIIQNRAAESGFGTRPKLTSTDVLAGKGQSFWRHHICFQQMMCCHHLFISLNVITLVLVSFTTSYPATPSVLPPYLYLSTTRNILRESATQADLKVKDNEVGGSEKGVYIVCADSKVMRDRDLCVHIQKKKKRKKWKQWNMIRKDKDFTKVDTHNRKNRGWKCTVV